MGLHPRLLGSIRATRGDGVWGGREILREAATTGGIVGGERHLAGIDRETALAPVLQFGDLPVGEGAGVAQVPQDSVVPEFGEFLPAAGRNKMKVAVGGEDAGRREDVHMRVPKEEVPKAPDGDDEARLAVGLPGAVAKPSGDRGVRGVVEFVQQGAVIFERRADQPGEGENEVPVGYDSADLVGDESGLDEGAALVTGRAEAALLAGEGEEVLVAAVGAMKAGEAGVDVAAFEERLDGGGASGERPGT